MADATVNVLIKAQADINQAYQSFGDLKKFLSGSNFSKGFTDQITKDFGELDKFYNKYQNALGKVIGGDRSSAALSNITKTFREFETAITNITTKYGEFNSEISKNITSPTLEQLKSDIASTSKLIEDMLNKYKTSFSNIQIPNNLASSDQRMVREIDKNLNLGNIEQAKSQIEALKQSIDTNINEINLRISTLKNSEGQLKSLQTSFEQFSTGLQKMSGTIDNLKPNTVASLSAQLKQLTSASNIGNSSIAKDIRGQLNATLDAANAGKIAEFTAAWKQLQATIKSTSNTKVDLTTPLKSIIDGSFTRKMNEAVGQQSSINNLKASFDSLWNSLGPQGQKGLGDFKKSIDAAFQTGSIERFKAAYNSLIQQIAARQGDIANRLAGNQLSQSSLGSQTGELEAYNQALTTLLADIAAGNPNLEQYKTTLESLKNSLTQEQVALLQSIASGFTSVATSAQQGSSNIRSAGESASDAGNKMSMLESQISGVIGQFARFASAAGMIRIVVNSIKDAYNSVKELDSAMNSIAVVTNMTTKDLWNQIDDYTKMANSTGSTITGAYQVAQLYYQQGLSTNEVMKMSTETLKLARIAGIDYADATDYMTAAIKGFGLSYEDVNRVMDVYSNLAAHTAANTEEISIAMSKVASIAHSTGMSLENTAGILTQIIATTREAPETAGTSLKTVIARFSEVKKLISQGEMTGTTEEGEEIDVNKIETGLKKIGVALRDNATGEMRNLDDVLIELSSKWKGLDSITQRYIATLAAGSRQQSRFLSFISDYDALIETLNLAQDSEGAAEEQFDKTLDSLESKLNNLQNAWTAFTTGIANQDIIKGSVDALTAVLNAVNTITGIFPPAAQSVVNLTLVLLGLSLAAATAGSAIGRLTGNTVMGLGKEGLNLTRWGTGLLGILTKIPPQAWLVVAALAAIGVIWDGLTMSEDELAKNLEVTNKKLEEAKEKSQEFADNAVKAQSAIDGITENANITIGDDGQVDTSKLKGLEELRKGVGSRGENLNLSPEDYQLYLDLSELLVEAYPEIMEGYNSAAEAVANYGDELQRIVDLLKEKAKLEAQGTVDEMTTPEYKIGDGVFSKKTSDVGIIKRDINNQLSDTYTSMLGAASNYTITDMADGWTAWKEDEFGDLQNEVTNKDLYAIINKINSAASIQETQAAYQELIGLQEQLKGSYLGTSTGELIPGELEYTMTFINNLITATKAYIDATDEATDSLSGFYDLAAQAGGYDQMSSEQQAMVDNIRKTDRFKTGYSLDPEDLENEQSNADFLTAVGSYISAFENLDAVAQDRRGNIEITALQEALSGDNSSYFKMTAEDYQAQIAGDIQTLQDSFKDVTGMEMSDEEAYALLGLPNQEQTEQMVSTAYQSIQDTVNATIEEAQNGDVQPLKDMMSNYFSPEEMAEYFDENGELIVGDLSDTLTTAIQDQLIDSSPLDAVQQAIDQKQLNWKEAINEKDLTKTTKKINKTLKGSSKSFEDLSYRLKKQTKNIDKFAKELKDLPTDNFTEAIDKMNGVVDTESELFKDTTKVIKDNFGEAISSTGQDVATATESLAEAAINMEAFGTMSEEGAKSVLSSFGISGDAASTYAAKIAEAMTTADGNALLIAMTGVANAMMRGENLTDEEAKARVDAAYAYLAGLLKSKNSNSGGGGGGGGGGKSTPTYGKQDHFFNYIATKDQNDRKLEELKDEQEVLLDPNKLRKNLQSQVEYYEKASGSTKAYLDSVNEHMKIMEDDALKNYSNFFEILQDGSLRLKWDYFTATDDTVEELDEWIDVYTDLMDRQEELTSDLNKYKKEMKELWEDWRSDYINTTNDIADILKEADEKSLDEKEKYYEKLEEMASDYLDAVRDNIEEERNLRDTEKEYEDLEEQQRRLALLERDTSGRYDSEIAELREEIAETQQGLGDTQVDRMLDQLEKQNEADEKRHEELLDKLQEQIDQNEETRYYIQEAEAIIQQGDAAIIEALMRGDDYQQASDAERDEQREEWQIRLAGVTQYLDGIDNNIRSGADYIGSLLNSLLYQQSANHEEIVGVFQRQFEKRMELGHFASGGIVDFTGPAWVDGTKTEPEAFLNPYQTQLFSDLAEKLTYTQGIIRTDTPATPESFTTYNIDVVIENIGQDYDITDTISLVKEEIEKSLSERTVNSF